MDLHIERPELNAKSAEENIATVDTWISDTADKLNIALETINAKVNSISKTSSSSSGSSSGSKSSSGGGSDTSVLEAKVLYLGAYKEEASKLILGG